MSTQLILRAADGKPGLVVSPTTEPPRRAGVYCWRNVVTERLYVGKALLLGKRRVDHIKSLASGKHRNPYLQNSWNTYGAEAFLFYVIEVCPPSRCARRETYWIRVLRSAERLFGFNMRAKGVGTLGFKFTEESRRRMSEAGKRRAPPSEETRRKLSAAGLGRKYTRASRRKMSKSFKGRQFSESTRKKISDTLKRKGQSAEWRAKIAAAVGSPETRAKMSKAHKGVPLSPTHKANLAAALRSPEVRKKISETLKKWNSERKKCQTQ